MMLRLRSWTSSLLLTLGLSGCSVYAPMLPATPQLRDKGQAEVQATSFLNGRWEGAGTYSPVKHMLVRAAGGFKTDSQDTTYFRVRQYEVGLGGYYPISNHFLISGLGGYGQAVSNRGYVQPQLFTGESYNVDFKARYHKYFGEVSALYYNSWVSTGLALRMSQIRFDRLTYNGEPLPLQHMTRVEPMLFARFGAEEGALRWLQVQTSAGITTVPGNEPNPNSLDPYEFEYSRIREGRIFLALSLVFYPHLLGKPKL
ncbi:hypothetical protein [Hymenobacter metallicola]|uniref:DUF2490 domain-containing protein n=1 Tax=Hymenobacter metallicola TaxID=2563114 RepID=A0A4Z0Q053_9BACT|nr:hypothetical protein [Hymenobacter metallicola]TGE23408.1 hypothetical protein E5K02_19630 [Hymenobacter metallicola]